MYLSKSKYCTGIQCPKILWMDKNLPTEKAEQDDSHLIIGNTVGDLAMGYFGDFSEVPFNHENISEMREQTQRMLENGIEVIAEASFSYDGNFCSVDILRKAENGYEIIEVKSSTGSIGDAPEHVKQIYLDDMAYQYFVVSNCGLPITKVSLMQLNSEYIRRGALNLQELFVLIDCTKEVLQRQQDISNTVAVIKAIAMQETEPEYQIGSRCDSPYSCGYKGWCYRNLPENNVFNIGFRMRNDKKDTAYQEGIVSFEDIINSSVKLNDHQLLQVKTAVNNLPPHIDPNNIRQFLNSLSYPLYHLDFETYQQPVPLWDGVKPYQQIPFQYSLHIQDKSCAEPIHKEFLGMEGTDPRRDLAERLCADIPGDVCVLAFNASFEKGRIRELAGLFPDLAEHLMCIHANIMDLAEPFARGYYYHRDMGGSYSIKVVLPAICGDDPELDYHKLDLIHNGGEAMTAYATLHERSPEEIAEIRTALLAYCRLDTLAMVKILEKLYAAAK